MPFYSHPSSPAKAAGGRGRQDPAGDASHISTGMLRAAEVLGSLGNPTHPLPAAEPKPPLAQNTTTSLPKRKPVHPGAPSPQIRAPYPDHPPQAHGTTTQLELRPTRAHEPARQPEELHLPTPSSSSTMSDVHHYQRSNSYVTNEPVQVHVQQASPHHQGSTIPNNVPGSLQPGPMGRPAPVPSAATSGSVPQLPQISTQLHEPTTPSRATTVGHTPNHTHNYSRSSPAGLDQPKYKPFNSTPETSQYSSPIPNFVPQTPQGASQSPLGLADIRPFRGNTNFSDGPTSPSVYPNNGELQFPTTSNYLAPWPIYALDWCKWPLRQHGTAVGKIAIGSYLEDNHNYIQILDAHKVKADPDNPQGETALEFVKTAEAHHAYPVTRVLWEPQSSQKQSIDLLATSGDHLRLWSLPAEASQFQSNSINRSPDQPLQKISPLALLSNSKSPEHTAPITSLDWNTVSPSLIITSSIDTTCTIWDIPTLTAKTQLIAHDKEVFDVRFCAQSIDVFVSCGADGSVRMFDLRSLEHSTIIYEPSEKNDKATTSPGNLSPTTPSSANPNASFPPPLLRIAASPHDSHLLATFSQDSSLIRVLDVRQPGQALLELRGHGAAVNAMEWSPNHRGLLASGADDSLVLVWDLMGHAGAVTPGGANQERGPSAAWQCEFEVANLSWAPGGELGVVGGRGFWGVAGI